MFSGSENVSQALKPGYMLNTYPEKRVFHTESLRKKADEVACRLHARSVRKQAMLLGHRVAADVESAIGTVSYDEIIGLRERLHQDWCQETLEYALALAGRQVRAHFGFSLHPSQYAAAWSLLQGTLVEMATGEGKTLTAAVAAAIAGLGGIQVHVITTNDYLVERDALSMKPLYRALDLECDFVVQGKDDDARRRAYACSVCYVSNKLVVFDYLRDRQLLGREPSALAARVRGLSRVSPKRPLLTGLGFAIVDEADSALIDDAVTPLILSLQGDSDDELATSLTAISLAKRLTDRKDYRIDQDSQTVRLTASGERQVALMATGLTGVWGNRRYRAQRVSQALSALRLYRRDVDYLVKDDCIVLIDQSTGRVMPDRKLANGMHQMLETKEKCELTGEARTVASLSFQKFFTRYSLLAGMTGTAREASHELRQSYHLGVVPIPTHRPALRRYEGAVFAATRENYFSHLVSAVLSCLQRGQPVLVGTRSLKHSEDISNAFSVQGLAHQVLNARQDQNEAEQIARAGQSSSITIATNMAGRGTDITISDEVRQSGGLHVIVSQLNDSPRIDRQLIGRCSRQGDPGSYEYIISPDDKVWNQAKGTDRLSAYHARLAKTRYGNHRLYVRARRLQKKLERQQRTLRRQVARSDLDMQKRLAFTGYKE